MSVKLPWMPFYGADFFADETVKLCSLRQHGIYLYLLWHQWQEGSIPCLELCQRFPVFLADPLSASPDAVHDVELIHSACFSKHPTLKQRFFNERLEAIRNEQLEKMEKIHDRAVKGGLAKAQLKQSLSTAQAEPKHTLSYANQSQKKKEKKNLNPDPEKSALHARVEDRDGKGFKPLGQEVLKAIQSWPKEIP